MVRGRASSDQVGFGLDQQVDNAGGGVMRHKLVVSLVEDAYRTDASRARSTLPLTFVGCAGKPSYVRFLHQ